MGPSFSLSRINRKMLMWGQPPSAVRRAKLDAFLLTDRQTEPLPCWPALFPHHFTVTFTYVVWMALYPLLGLMSLIASWYVPALGSFTV